MADARGFLSLRRATPRREPLHEQWLRQQVLEVVVPTEPHAARDEARRMAQAQYDAKAERLLQVPGEKDS